MRIPIWLVPSYFGDIRVIEAGPKACKVLVEQATSKEREALAKLQLHATKKRWLTDGHDLTARTITPLMAPTKTVATFIARQLKPGKKLVSAVLFKNGRIEEVTASTFESGPAEPTKTPESETTGTSPSTSASEPKAATTVTKPVKGCPPPNFSPARLRALEVLMTFLTPEQQEDFLRFNRFVAIGGTTGHRYMITSRHATDQLGTFTRSLFDLDDEEPLCVHDWSVPPEEELHMLNILVQLPGYEAYLRELETTRPTDYAGIAY